MSKANHFPPQWTIRLTALLSCGRFDEDAHTFTAHPEAIRFFLAQAQVEGGISVENPTNTTYGLAGSTTLEGNTDGVRNYRSDTDPRPVEGISAMAITLAAKDKTPDPKTALGYRWVARYPILGDLQRGVKTAEQIVDDNAASLHTWAPNDPDYAKKIKTALETIT
jgi:hypothetical protein